MVSDPWLSWRVERHGGTVTVWLSGELDLASGRHLAGALSDEDTWSLLGVTAAVFDLGDVSFLDGAGLARLMFLRDGLDLAGIPTLLVRASPAVRRVARLAGVERFLARSQPEGMAS